MDLIGQSPKPLDPIIAFGFSWVAIPAEIVKARQGRKCSDNENSNPDGRIDVPSTSPHRTHRG